MMDKFEASFEEVDMRSACLEGAMDSATSASMPEEEVDSLLAQVRVPQRDGACASTGARVSRAASGERRARPRVQSCGG